MHTIHQTEKLNALLDKRRKQSKIVGFVPTMGALHQGHFSLIKKAQKESDAVVVSIFVNPTQFDNPSDLEKYPQSLEDDRKKLASIFKDLIVFAPSVNTIYGQTPEAENFDFGSLAKKMEGKFRAGHFNGVGTVLKKLFALIKPDKAFFGKKDYQQFLIVKKLVELEHLPITIVGCPISRLPNGLARSSRNKRLTQKQRKKATLLHNSLLYAKAQFGTKNAQNIVKKVEEKIEADPAFQLEYFEIAEAENLEPAKNIKPNTKYRGFIAAHFEGVRLIDNIALN